MNTKNVLVTGGAGFIGSNFIRYLLKVEPQARVVNLDALTYAGRLENLNDLPDPRRHIFIQGDICDAGLINGLLRRYRIDTIVHFAAETHVDRSIVSPELFIKTNVMGTLNLVNEAWKFWLIDKALIEREPRFHHISTDEVFGSLGPAEKAWTELAPYSPNSPYAASKAASDHLVRAYGHTYGLPYSITNCSNNYGPYQFPEKLIPLIVLNALGGKPLPIYGDGKQIRDWLYVEDHCEAIWLVVNQGRPGYTYNVGGGVHPTNLEIIEDICKLLDEMRPNSRYTPHRSLMRFIEDRPGHDRRYAINSKKIETELGWKPKCTLTVGLRKTIEWYLEHPEWIAAICEKCDYKDWIKRNYAERGGSK